MIARNCTNASCMLLVTVAAANAQSGRSNGKDAPHQTVEKTTVTTTTTSTAAAEDKMEDIQSFNTWTSLEDGQPGQRGELQLNVFNGWETGGGEPDVWTMDLELEYSPKGGNWLLDNAKFGIDVPFELTNGAVDGNGDVSLTWKQRLFEEDRDGAPATFTIENELRIPSGYHSSGVDWTVQGVIAKELGPGTAVFNAFAKSANGHNNVESASWWNQEFYGEEDESLEHFQWGARVGYKWRLTDTFALVTDYIYQNSDIEGQRDQNIGELAAEWRVNDCLTIGPGIMFGLDGRENTPNFGAGVLVHYSWE